MEHNIDYTFELMIGNLDNPNAVNRSITYQIRFDPPRPNEVIPEEIKASQCEKLDISSNGFVRKDTRNVIDFNKEDWNISDVSALQTLDLLSNAARSPCG